MNSLYYQSLNHVLLLLSLERVEYNILYCDGHSSSPTHAPPPRHEGAFSQKKLLSYLTARQRTYVLDIPTELYGCLRFGGFAVNFGQDSLSARILTRTRLDHISHANILQALSTLTHHCAIDNRFISVKHVIGVHSSVKQ